MPKVNAARVPANLPPATPPPVNPQPAASNGATKPDKPPKVVGVPSLLQAAQEAMDIQEVMYPEIFNELRIVGGTGVEGEVIRPSLREEDAVSLLGWETEEQYAARMKRENPGIDEAQCTFGEEYTLKDTRKRKVRCWLNSKNRPFYLTTAESYAQDVLTRKWAGIMGGYGIPDVEGDTINGENIIISKYGNVISGQHRLIGFKLSCEMWEGKNQSQWKLFWPQKPVFPCSIMYGVSESTLVTSTIDNVRPRTEGDVIYTSGIFDRFEGRVMTIGEREKCSLSMSKCRALLWKRTWAGHSELTNYQTHGTAVGFIDRHKYMIQCVQRIFARNQNNQLKMLGLSEGKCAALLYLMAASATDEMDYYTPDSNPLDRNEGMVDFSMKGKAEEFWDKLSRELKEGYFRNLPLARRPREGDEDKDTMGGLIFGAEEPGTEDEKIATVVNAWHLFLQEEEIAVSSLALRWHCEVGSDGTVTKRTLLKGQWSDIGGIDRGEPEVEKPSTTSGAEHATGATASGPVDESDGDEELVEEGEPIDLADEQLGNEGDPTEEQIQELRKSKAKERPVNESPEDEKARRASVETKAEAPKSPPAPTKPVKRK